MAASFQALFEQLAPLAEPRPEAKSQPRPVAPAFGALAELLGAKPRPARAAPAFGALAELLTAAPTPVPAGDKPIVLIACSDTKIDTKGRAVPAADLYSSPLFRKSLAYARAITTEESIRILSGLHGVLRTTDRIATYDYPITKLTARERDEWGERAHTTLLGQFGQKRSRDVIVLAGEEYVNALHGLTNTHRRDALPWTITYPFGAARGERMQIGQRLRWLNDQLRALGHEPPPAPKKPAPLKPGRIRMNTRGRPWREVEALAWEGDFFVHVDVDDEDVFTITHAPTGRAWQQRFTDERSAIVYAADLNSPEVRPEVAQFVEAVEKKWDGLRTYHGATLARLLAEREPLRLAEYRRRYGQDPPANALAPRSEREPQSQLSERSPTPAPAPAAGAAPQFGELAQLLGGADAVAPPPQSETRPSRKTAPTSEAWSYLGTVGGHMVWPDVGTRVRWNEDTEERRGKVVRHGTRELVGTITRITVDEMNPRDIDVWAQPDDGGAERRVGIGGIRIPTADLPAFTERAKHWFEKRMRAQYGEWPPPPPSAPAPAVTEKREIAQFLIQRAERFAPVWPRPGESVSAANAKIAAALRAEATAIQRAPDVAGQTAHEARLAALRHLRSLAAKTKGKPGEALFVAANDIEGGMHLGLEEEPASSAPDPRRVPEALKQPRPTPNVPSFADLVASLEDTAPAESAPVAAPLSVASDRERAQIVAYLQQEAATAEGGDAKHAAQQLRAIADDVAKMAMPAAELRRTAIGRLVAHALLKTAEELRARKHYTKGELDAIEAAEGERSPAAAPPEEAPATARSVAVPPRGEVANILLQDGTARAVHVLGRDGDLIVHADLVTPAHFALTHATTNRKVAEFGTREEALAFAMDLNRPEIRPLFEKHAAGDESAARAFGKAMQKLALGRMERWRLAEEARQIAAAAQRLGPVESTRAESDEREQAAAARSKRRASAPASSKSLRERIIDEIRVQSHSAEVLAGILGADLAAVREQLAQLLASGAIYQIEEPREGPPAYTATTAPRAVPPDEVPPAEPISAPEALPDPEAVRLALPALPATAQELRWRVLQLVLTRGRTAEDIAAGLHVDPGVVREELSRLHAGQYVKRTRAGAGVMEYRADLEAVMRKRRARERDLQASTPRPLELARVGGGGLLIGSAPEAPEAWRVTEANADGHPVWHSRPLAWADAVAAAVARDGDPRCARDLPPAPEAAPPPATDAPSPVVAGASAAARPAPPPAVPVINSAAAIKRLPLGTRFRMVANALGPLPHPTVRVLVAVTPRHADFRIEDESDPKNGQVSRLVLKGVTVEPRHQGFAVTDRGRVLAEYIIEASAPPAVDFFHLPLPTALRLVKRGDQMQDSGRVLVEVKKATELEKVRGKAVRVEKGTLLGLRVDDISDKRHGLVEWVLVDPQTTISPRPNGFALVRRGELLGEYRFQEEASAPPSVGAWTRALSAQEQAQEAEERAQYALARADVDDWLGEAQDSLERAQRWAAQTPAPTDSRRVLAEARRRVEDARALSAVQSFRALPADVLQRLVEDVPDDKDHRRLRDLLVKAQEQGAYGVPSAQGELLFGSAEPAGPQGPEAPQGPHTAAPAAGIPAPTKPIVPPVTPSSVSAPTKPIVRQKGPVLFVHVGDRPAEAAPERKPSEARGQTPALDDEAAPEAGSVAARPSSRRPPVDTDAARASSPSGEGQAPPAPHVSRVPRWYEIVRFTIPEDVFENLPNDALRALRRDSKSLGIEWAPPNATHPTYHTAPVHARSYQAVARALAHVPSWSTDDATTEYAFGATRASADYDGFGTVQLGQLSNKDRIVAIRRDHHDWQVQRYFSSGTAGFKPITMAEIERTPPPADATVDDVDAQATPDSKPLDDRGPAPAHNDEAQEGEEHEDEEHEGEEHEDDEAPEPGIVALVTPVEHRTAAKRRDANIKAMWLAADLEAHPRPLTDEERRTLLEYSDWGGVGIGKWADKFPPGFPVPEKRQLIHAYFTPSAVCAEIARVLKPLLPGLVSTDGKVHALEPSSGIGRFPLALSGPGFENLAWHCVELSTVSYKMLRLLRPDIDLFHGPFERWIAERAESFAGRLKLVVSNPPYADRNMALTEDPDRSYRYDRADVYFLRRGLDLLGAGGIGVYIIPSGFLTGTTPDAKKLREEVLRRHHLMSAFRLPNEVWSLANVVTDILFFRARGAILDEVDEADRFILDGRYYEEFPTHILGKVVPNEPGKRGWHSTAEGYTVVGEFTALPAFEERPMCASCMHLPAPATEPPPAMDTAAVSPVEHIVDHDERMAAAVGLGRRVEAFLASVANPDHEPVGWDELHHDLAEWAAIHGPPGKDKDVIALALAERGPLGRGEPGGAGWLLKAFIGKSATLIQPLAERPRWAPRFVGDPNDPLQIGDHLYRTRKRLTIDDLPGKDPSALFAAGWCEDSERLAWTERLDVRGELFPPDEYLYGELWPKFDRADARGRLGDVQAAAQARRLLELIQPATFDEIEVSPQDGFVPLELVATWLATLNHGDAVHLARDKGLVHLADVAYEDHHGRGLLNLSHEALLCLGWINHDYVVFQPPAGEDEKIDEIRLAYAKDWTERFRAFCEAEPERQRAIEHAYQRARQGYRAHGYGSEPLKLARWNPAVVLNPHQIAGARRLDANHGGGLGFDVGVGKTFTILAALALARQQGRARRPVIVVPQPIALQWVDNIGKALPNFRVVVIGLNKKTISRGLRKGLETSETDTPEERSRKWARFQGGEFDVAIVTYESLPRSKMDQESTLRFIDGVTAIEREVELKRRNAKLQQKQAAQSYREKKEALETKLERAKDDALYRTGQRQQKALEKQKKLVAQLEELEEKHAKRKLTERQEAILEEGVGAWLAEMLELPEGWRHDPDIVWQKLGITWIAFDEAHNGKNLHMPSSREGGAVPKFMGNEGEGSHRAWHWYFRCCDVQSRGGEVVLATATPASNSPLEFYNLVKLIDDKAWARIGIHDPEAFIDRFCMLAPEEVVGVDMQTTTRMACVGFKNLDELRSVVMKLWEFKTAKQAGLKLPKAKIDRAFVDLDAAQEKKYQRYVDEIELALSNPKEGSHKILGLLQRMASVAQHAQLDEKFEWSDAHMVTSPHSPKYDELARRVLALRGCGHIVFSDYVPAHAWIRDVLVEAGIPPQRIGILNAVVAPTAADRQRTAREFNGSDTVAPKYDVLIANMIGEEGVDLQRRACAIHHMDIGWTPKKFDQRNGRGYRQGNTLSNIEIVYYIANRSQDGARLDMVRGKQNWISSLLEGEGKEVNNPAAQSTLTRKELLVLISRDPEKTRARMEAAEAEREEERKKKVAAAASGTLRAVANRFDRARTEQNPTVAAEHLSVARQKLAGLAKVDPTIWPWMPWAMEAERHPMLVPKDGGPVYEGLRVAMPRILDRSQIDYAEFGRIDGSTIGTRVAGTAHWEETSLDKVVQLRLEPQMRLGEGNAGTWPADDEAGVDRAMTEKWLPRLRSGSGTNDAWRELGWMRAPDRFVEQQWARWGAEIVRAMQSTGGWAANLRVPAIRGDRLVLGLTSYGSVVPPTQAGYAEFLRLGPASGLKFTELEDAAVFWWNRGIPRNLLSAARGAQASEEEAPPQNRLAPSPAPPSARAALNEAPQAPEAPQEPEARQGPQEPRRHEASPSPVRMPSPAPAAVASTSAPSVRVPPPVRVPSPPPAVASPSPVRVPSPVQVPPPAAAGVRRGGVYDMGDTVIETTLMDYEPEGRAGHVPARGLTRSTLPVWRSFTGSAELRVRDLEREHNDAHVLLVQLFHDHLRAEVPDVLRVRSIPLTASLLEQARTALEEDWDERGPEYVAALSAAIERGVPMPPAVVMRGALWDGKHRILAADQAGLEAVPAIDLGELQADKPGGEPTAMPEPAAKPATERPMGMYQKLSMAGGVWGVRLQGQRPQPGERVKVQTRKGKIKTETVAHVVHEGLDYFLCTIVEASTAAA